MSDMNIPENAEKIIVDITPSQEEIDDVCAAFPLETAFDADDKTILKRILKMHFYLTEITSMAASSTIYDFTKVVLCYVAFYYELLGKEDHTLLDKHIGLSEEEYLLLKKAPICTTDNKAVTHMIGRMAIFTTTLWQQYGIPLLSGYVEEDFIVSNQLQEDLIYSHVEALWRFHPEMDVLQENFWLEIPEKPSPTLRLV